MISVDDHVVEPPHTFEGRLPKHLQDRAPRVADRDGLQIWEFEDQKFTQVGMNAIAGRKPTQKKEPFRFDQMRPSCYDVDARVRDMDINGVWAAVNFPSMVTGFCGRVFFNAEDPELGQACIRAWNDWLYEEWYLAHPTRIVPLGIAFLSDPDAAVAEIHRNAERGFTGISHARATARDRAARPVAARPLGPDHPGLRRHRHRRVAARRQLGLGRWGRPTHPGCRSAPRSSGSSRCTSAAEWLWSEYPVKHPTLKIAMSEGGIGWVAMLLDRLDNIIDRSGYGAGWDERPADVLQRNFWFCTLDDPSTIDTRYRIGVENIMVETDFPHGDGTWPDTQLVIEKLWGHIPDDELRMMCCENAAKLYRHPLPDVVLPR